VEKLSITLNSFGPKIDWLRMDEFGCLKIEKFTTN